MVMEPFFPSLPHWRQLNYFFWGQTVGILLIIVVSHPCTASGMAALSIVPLLVACPKILGLCLCWSPDQQSLEQTKIKVEFDVDAVWLSQKQLMGSSCRFFKFSIFSRECCLSEVEGNIIPGDKVEPHPHLIN